MCALCRCCHAKPSTKACTVALPTALRRNVVGICRGRVWEPSRRCARGISLIRRYYPLIYICVYIHTYINWGCHEYPCVYVCLHVCIYLYRYIKIYTESIMSQKAVSRCQVFWCRLRFACTCFL